MNRELQEVAGEIYKRHQDRINYLTREQFTEAMSQALISGDFQRHVFIHNDSQKVDYVPYREREALKSRIKELEEAISTANL